MKKTDKIKSLLVTKITAYQVDYYNLEDFIKSVYGKDYSFIQDQECGNDSSHEFHISKKKLRKYDQKKLEEFANDGEYCFSADVIMGDLCHKGLIEPGHYIVKVCW
jgi:hypothetical protein